MYKAENLDKRIQSHRDRAEHHDKMADKEINKEYHMEQAAHHRNMADKLETEKNGSKKDLGPMSTPMAAPIA